MAHDEQAELEAVERIMGHIAASELRQSTVAVVPVNDLKLLLQRATRPHD